MKKGQKTTIKIQDTKIDVTFLGKGYFSTAYLSADGTTVYIFTKNNDYNPNHTDMSKYAIAEWSEGLHIPQIERVEETDKHYVYKMPFYQPLTPANKQAWKDFKTLLNVWNKVWRETDETGYYFNSKFIEFACGQVSEQLIDALTSINDSLANWGNFYQFEIAKRNLGVDSDGNLILLDIAFNRKAIGFDRS